MGKGDFAVALAKRDIQVLGIDLNADLREYAILKAREAGVENRIEFTCGDAETLKFPDASFAAVMSLRALHHFEKPETALAEMNRFKEFDYLVINREGHLDEAVEQIVAIIRAEKCRIVRRQVVL